MVQVEKKEDRSPGDRLPIGKVKSEIISYILSKNEAVSVTDLKTHLREKYGIRNKKNIDNHLNGLEDDNCIEKIKPPRDGFENKWDITKIENLKNIMSLFSEIRLNKYEKSVNIVLKKFNFAAGSMRTKKAFVQLSLSASFFGKCLDTDIETLRARASKFYQADGDFMERKIERQIEGLIHEAYPECMKRIQKIPGIWSVTDEEYIKDSVNLDVYQNSPQSFQNSTISEEKFQEILEEINFPLEEKNSHKQIQIIVKELSMKISDEILSKREKKFPKDSLQNQEELNEMSDEIFEKLMEEYPADLPAKTYTIVVNQYQNTSISFDKVFDHFYQRDIIDGSDIYEEREFVSKINEITSISMLKVGNLEVKVKKLDDLYDDYYEKCRKKMGII
ncbi:MAG: hypothetical protein QG646_2197 [Euryarchaeota archaeon]|nr:hypothetical protein [Euryarchaeota archaeon]